MIYIILYHKSQKSIRLSRATVVRRYIGHTSSHLETCHFWNFLGKILMFQIWKNTYLTKSRTKLDFFKIFLNNNSQKFLKKVSHGHSFG
jgi:hypothetical protein